MAAKHSYPTKARIDRNGNPFYARAPYNFVPLPEMVVPAAIPPAQDTFTGLTGWIDCDIETLSPTYVRGMLNSKSFEDWGQKKSDELTPEQKALRAGFFSSPAQAKVEGLPAPSIPGSTMRGMVRSVLEIVSYAHVRRVGDTPTFTYRAVAASRDDPLSAPYKNLIGSFGRNVRAGYLKKLGESWQVIPALQPRQVGLATDDAYFKVKERTIDSKAIPGFLRFNSEDYHPQVHPVSFNAEKRTGRDNRPFIFISAIGKEDAGFSHKGKLICSGNMIEGAPKGQKSRRTSHALILGPDTKVAPLHLSDQVIKDYRNGITPYQGEDVANAWHGEPGVLAHGNPIFYIASGNEVIAFGHCPNFRIPARQLFGKLERAATPADFVPPALQETNTLDLAEAIFGWIDGTEKNGEQCAGRVFFSDALYVGNKNGVWYRPDPIVPHTLAGPKPTTFQHYLVQDRSQGHDPDNKVTLAHYGTLPQQTEIRGSKFYWTKGANPPIEANASEMQHESQLTRIRPLKPGVKFSFRLRFENLRPEELGALMWVLSLPEQCCHRIGMGKPLGMGAVKIMPKLCLSDRKARYQTIFAGNAWAQPSTEAEKDYKLDFEKFILQNVAPNQQHLADVERIKELLLMLEWRDGESSWMDWTRYMEIEHGPGKANEYKERPVLPSPSGVVAQYRGRPMPRDPVATQVMSAGKTQDTPAAQIQGSHPVPPPGFQSGTVKSFGLGENKSYGFIQPDNGGNELFVHMKALTTGLTILVPGQRVVFKVGKNMQGKPTALDVRLEGSGK